MTLPDQNTPRPVLWTGGWDSTYRVLELLLCEQRAVEPHYLINPQRRSHAYEVRAMEHIRQQLTLRNPEAAARLGPLQGTRVTDLPADELYRQRLQAIRRLEPLGPQYEWLARYRRSAGLASLELCIHRDDRAHHVLEGHVAPAPQGGWMLRPDLNETALGLFAGFVFPVFGLTKLEMAERANSAGFADLLELSWFCHDPTPEGKPCGVCPGCVYTRNEGLGRRVPPLRGWSRLRRALVDRLPWPVVRYLRERTSHARTE